MYESLLGKYRVFFEGLPDPVFYKCFYPMGRNTNDWLWEMFNYSQGLKIDKDPDEQKYREFYPVYTSDLKDLLNLVMAASPGKKRGVAVIPSSKKNITNRVTMLTREVLARNPRPFSDLTRSIYRAVDKPTAHSGGVRSVQSNVETLAVKDPRVIAQLDVLVVLDDVVSKGTSFRAIGQLLRKAGFKGTLVNFAFTHTYPAKGVVNFLNHEPHIEMTGINSLRMVARYLPDKRKPLRSGFYIPLNDGSCCLSRTSEIGSNLKLDNGKTIKFTNPGTIRHNMKKISYRPTVDAVIFDFDQTL